MAVAIGKTETQFMRQFVEGFQFRIQCMDIQCRVLLEEATEHERQLFGLYRPHAVKRFVVRSGPFGWRMLLADAAVDLPWGREHLLLTRLDGSREPQIAMVGWQVVQYVLYSILTIPLPWFVALESTFSAIADLVDFYDRAGDFELPKQYGVVGVDDNLAYAV